MREAPEAVVEAVAKAIHDAQDTGYEWDTFESSWWDHAREEARGIADAAWAAAYPAALRDAADRLMRDADISRVDLEVLLPSSPGRQCDCCHPTSDEAFSLVISRTRDRLRRWADESEA